MSGRVEEDAPEAALLAQRLPGGVPGSVIATKWRAVRDHAPRSTRSCEVVSSVVPDLLATMNSVFCRSRRAPPRSMHCGRVRRVHHLELQQARPCAEGADTSPPAPGWSRPCRAAPPCGSRRPRRSIAKRRSELVSAAHRLGDGQPAEAVGLGDLGRVVAPQRVVAAPDALDDLVARQLQARLLQPLVQRPGTG